MWNHRNTSVDVDDHRDNTIVNIPCQFIRLAYLNYVSIRFHGWASPPNDVTLLLWDTMNPNVEPSFTLKLIEVFRSGNLAVYQLHGLFVSLRYVCQFRFMSRKPFLPTMHICLYQTVFHRYAAGFLSGPLYVWRK